MLGWNIFYNYFDNIGIYTNTYVIWCKNSRARNKMYARLDDDCLFLVLWPVDCIEGAAFIF